MSGNPRAEGKPALYLEILRFSCNFAIGADSLKTEKEMTELLLASAWLQGQVTTPDKFIYKAGINPAIFPRGIDALLNLPHEGLCQEWSLFLKALNHSQGGSLWFLAISLTDEQINADLRIWDKTPIPKTLVGLGGTNQIPPNPPWLFDNHAYNSFNLNRVYDLSFNRKNLSEENHINSLFELVNKLDGSTIPNPFPDSIHLFINHQ